MVDCKQKENDFNKLIEQKIKNQFEIIKRIDTYIGTTNTKCTIIMSYCAAVTAFQILLLSRMDLEYATIRLIVSIGLACSFSLITSVVCMLMACLTIFPITFSSPSNYRGTSLIFYGDIVNIKDGSGGYVRKINEVSEEAYLNDLSDQVFTLAGIVSNKFHLIQRLSVVLCVHFIFLIAFLMACMIHFLS